MGFFAHYTTRKDMTHNSRKCEICRRDLHLTEIEYCTECQHRYSESIETLKTLGKKRIETEMQNQREKGHIVFFCQACHAKLFANEDQFCLTCQRQFPSWYHETQHNQNLNNGHSNQCNWPTKEEAEHIDQVQKQIKDWEAQDKGAPFPQGWQRDADGSWFRTEEKPQTSPTLALVAQAEQRAFTYTTSAYGADVAREAEKEFIKTLPDYTDES